MNRKLRQRVPYWDKIQKRTQISQTTSNGNQANINYYLFKDQFTTSEFKSEKKPFNSVSTEILRQLL